METKKKTFYDHCVEKAADLVVWTTNHRKEIGTLIFGIVCYKIGYRRAEEKCVFTIANGIVDRAIGGK